MRAAHNSGCHLRTKVQSCDTANKECVTPDHTHAFPQLRLASPCLDDGRRQRNSPWRQEDSAGSSSAAYSPVPGGTCHSGTRYKARLAICFQQLLLQWIQLLAGFRMLLLLLLQRQRRKQRLALLLLRLLFLG